MTNAVNGRGRALPPEKSKHPGLVIAESERQWLYTEDELIRSPSIVNGMSPDEERLLRSKGVVFINSVGHMLKVPQTTITTASVFFHRFLMRYSLVSPKGSKVLHHYVRDSSFGANGADAT
jgi:protein BUR2